MLQQTKGIVLNRLYYREHDLIVVVYTQIFGKLSFVVYGARKAKAKFPQAFFYPFSILTLTIDFRENRTLQSIKEASLTHGLNAILYDMDKMNLAMFVCEVLSKVIQDNEPDASLYNFIEEGAIMLDSLTHSSNFHLFFLLSLTGYMGISPSSNYDADNRFFHVQKALFDEDIADEPDAPDEKISSAWNDLLCASTEESLHLRFKQPTRQRLLSLILRYYETHLTRLGTIKTLSIMKEMYAEK